MMIRRIRQEESLHVHLHVQCVSIAPKSKNSRSRLRILHLIDTSIRLGIMVMGMESCLLGDLLLKHLLGDQKLLVLCL
jgi:hypothetical protein